MRGVGRSRVAVCPATGAPFEVIARL